MKKHFITATTTTTDRPVPAQPSRDPEKTFSFSLYAPYDEGSVPEIAQYGPYYLPLNVSLLPKDQTCIFIVLARNKKK